MKFLSRSDNSRAPKRQPADTRVSYESVLKVASEAVPGVGFSINRISFGRRMELSRLVREIAQKVEFLEAGSELDEKVRAGLLCQEVDAMYLRWALVAVDGLRIDGEPATAEQLLERGPDALTREIVAAIKEQCGLSETERKN